METEWCSRWLPVILVGGCPFVAILMLRSAILGSFVAIVLLIAGSSSQMGVRQIRVCTISLIDHPTLGLSGLRRCSHTKRPHKLLFPSKDRGFEIIWSDGQYELPLTILGGSSPRSTIMAMSMTMVMRA